MDDAIRRAYAILGNHREVARRMKIPIHVVLYVLGIMSPELFRKIH